MAVFTESYFEARSTYGAIMAGCQYEIVATDSGHGLVIDDCGTCYEVTFDKYDPDVAMLKNAPLIKFDRVENDE